MLTRRSRAFLAQFPLCIVAFISVFFVLKLPAREDSHWKDKLRRIDFLGAIVLVGAVLGFVFGLDRGSNVSWKIPLTIASLSVSVVLFVLFVLVENYFAAEPFAPGHIIFNRTFFSLYGCNFFSFGGWLAALFYIPLYFQAVDGVSATIAGLRLLPSILAGVSGSLFAGILMKRTGKYYWLTIFSYTLLTIGCFVIFLFSGGAATSLTPMIFGMVIAAFGSGIGVTTTLIGLSKTLFMRDYHLQLADYVHSFQRYHGRSSSGHRLFISFPIPRVRHRTFSIGKCCSATPAGTTENRVAGQQGYR